MYVLRPKMNSLIKKRTVLLLQTNVVLRLITDILRSLWGIWTYFQYFWFLMIKTTFFIQRFCTFVWQLFLFLFAKFCNYITPVFSYPKSNFWSRIMSKLVKDKNPEIKSFCIALDQWFPTGVPLHTRVPWEGARGAANFWIC